MCIFVTCECGNIKLKDKRTFVLHYICIVTQNLFGTMESAVLSKHMQEDDALFTQSARVEQLQQKKTSTEMQTQF